MRKEGISTRFWCFTINNPCSIDDINLIFDNWNENVTFAVYNLEKGEEGTYHYQGYLELKRHKTLSWMKRKLPRAHLEKRKGSREQAILYCLKDCSESSTEYTNNSEENLQEKNYTQFPVLFNWESNWEELKKECLKNIQMKMPRKEALQRMKVMIEEGASDIDLANFNFSIFTSSYRALNYYRLLITKPRNFKTEVIICQGPTGTGKSRWCAENFPNAYWKQRSNWWDGYINQETVIIDEFYGWLPFDLCLRLCDRYPLQVETKGGNINFVAKRIIFTSNGLPGSWWKNVYFPSFARRVDEWHIFPIWGEHQIFKNYEDACGNLFINT